MHIAEVAYSVLPLGKRIHFSLNFRKIVPVCLKQFRFSQTEIKCLYLICSEMHELVSSGMCSSLDVLEAYFFLKKKKSSLFFMHMGKHLITLKLIT